MSGHESGSGNGSMMGKHPEQRQQHRFVLSGEGTLYIPELKGGLQWSKEGRLNE